MLTVAVERFECGAYVELELQSRLQSQDELQCVIGWYLLNLLAQRGITFSDGFHNTVANMVSRLLGGANAPAGTTWMIVRVLPKIGNRQLEMPGWEKILHSKEWTKLGT